MMRILALAKTLGWTSILTITGTPADKEKMPARLLTSATVLFLIIAGSPFAALDTNIASADSNPYAPNGTIVVNTNNDAASFTLTGPATYTGNGTNWSEPDAPTGTYNITYDLIPAYDTPVDDTQTLDNGDTIIFTGIYNRTINILTLQASADAHISQQTPGKNFGTESTMQVRSYYQGTNKNGRSLIMFDTSSIPYGSDIISATLQLNASSIPDGARNYTVNRVEQNWDELNVTWNNRPEVYASVTSSADTPSSQGWMSWDVTPDVKEWIDGNPNYGWQISDQSEDSDKTEYTATFYTREHSDTNLRPELVIQYMT